MGDSYVLRVAVRLGDLLLEEQVIRRRGTVTIGQSVKCTLSVPASTKLPRSFPLFDVDGSGHVMLNFTDEMTGRIARTVEHKGETGEVYDLLALMHPRPRPGQVRSVALPLRARGKVTIGDVTVLFQLVAAPPVQPRPRLPSSVRSSLWRNLDWLLVGLVTGSLFAHISFVAYLRGVDYPKVADVETLPDRFIRFMPKVEAPKPKLPDKIADATPQPAREPAPKADRSSAKPNPKPGPSAEEAAIARARLEAKVQSMGALQLLGSRGERGAIADLLRGGNASSDADRVFAEVGGVGVATTIASSTPRGGGAPGQLRGGTQLRAGGPQTVAIGDRHEQAVRGVVCSDCGGPIDRDPTVDPESLIKEIKSRLGGIRACYEAGLKPNPGLGGKIVLRFELSGIGKVTSAEIENDTMGDADVAHCITQKVKTWRLPAPAGGGSAQFSYPFVFQVAK